MPIAGTATIAEGTTRHYIGPNSGRATNSIPRNWVPRLRPLGADRRWQTVRIRFWSGRGDYHTADPLLSNSLIAPGQKKPDSESKRQKHPVPRQWPPAGRGRTYAAHLFSAAMVQPVGPGGGRGALRRLWRDPSRNTP